GVGPVMKVAPGWFDGECVKSVDCDDAQVSATMRRAGADADVTLKIPRPLYDQLKQVIQGSGFHSVTEFAVYVLRDLLSHHEIPRAPAPGHPAESEPTAGVEPLSPEEIEAIRARLSSLGYL
ncbi:MAG: ribbon-helix-helix domain-containing protein, partial [Actinomycetota bacterium]|nr:ribbon-helix-helix domain-containing protein [Actinomycetota bacterium]